jgi:hypothetical protein
MDDEIREIQKKLCDLLVKESFEPVFISTDGDTGMEEKHREFFRKYEDMKTVNLDNVVAELEGQDAFHRWPVSDPLHLVKNARSRLVGGALAFTADGHEISGPMIHKELELEGEERAFEAKGNLDAMRDDLALQVFTMKNLLALAEKRDDAAGIYFLPWVCLCHAIRNPRLSIPTRLDLLAVAFYMFFVMKRCYPKTGRKAGIVQQGGATGTKTFWRTSTCVRGCNLCVALYWAIWKYGEGTELALYRIGSHSVECLFGMTRSMLNNDMRWGSFLSTQAKAMMIHNMMKNMGLRPYIRRFMNEGGCCVLAHEVGLVDHILTQEAMDEIKKVCVALAEKKEPANPATLGWFKELRDSLIGVGFHEKVPHSSPRTGHSIGYRFLSGAKQE